METHFNGLNLRFSHLTSTATPFKQMNFSRNGNKRSSIESKNKGIAVIKYQEWLNVISTTSGYNRQKFWFLNLTFSDKIFFFCTFDGIKIQTISAYHVFRKYRLKNIYSGTNFSIFFDFRLILSITAQSIFAVEPICFFPKNR
jgi:hypothetical protein